ncbi:MAG: hypothetical protein K8J31_20785 [Anaerolineae bacterium]|nr:hypothetical protein [Anaerolineae bacterium]
MQIVFDVVDLLQLQEIWVRHPIAQAYSRLERRRTVLPCPVEFQLRQLMPRLGQLRNSSAWQANRLEKRADPAQIPMCAMTDAYLEILFPDEPSQGMLKRQLFVSVYNHFVVSQYRGDVSQTCGLLRALAEVRMVNQDECLSDGSLPLEGSNFWIPIDLTDEVRALDARYDSSKPNTPATYVVAESFWSLLVKASDEEVRAAAAAFCGDAGMACVEDCTQRLQQMADLARDWNRSSSVVGLYYQVSDESERN